MATDEELPLEPPAAPASLPDPEPPASSDPELQVLLVDGRPFLVTARPPAAMVPASLRVRARRDHAVVVVFEGTHPPVLCVRAMIVVCVFITHAAQPSQ